jgi:hypothetical protein
MHFCWYSLGFEGGTLTGNRTLKWHFSTLESDDRGLNETRANACEIVAWRFLTQVSERDAVDFCLYELPPVQATEESSDANGIEGEADERTDLLQQFRAQTSLAPISPARPGSKRVELLRSLSGMGIDPSDEAPVDTDEEGDPTTSFTGLNGLEIAAVADMERRHHLLAEYEHTFEKETANLQ